MGGLQEFRRSTVGPPWQSSVRSIDRHRRIRLMFCKPCFGGVACGEVVDVVLRL